MNKREGSTSIIYAVEPGIIARQFLDVFSVFDKGRHHQTIYKLGESRCACAVRSFDLLERAGTPTHFVRQVDERTFHMREYEVPGKQPLSGKVHGKLIPLEWLWRGEITPKFLGRIESGEVSRDHPSIAALKDISVGAQLKPIFQECTTKLESIDRYLTSAEARKIGGLNGAQWKEGQLLMSLGQLLIEDGMRRADYKTITGKGELALGSDGKLLYGDVVGTPDEDEIVDLRTGKRSDKSILRNKFERLGYKAELDEAKKLYPLDKSKWPPYPSLEESFRDQVSIAYASVAYRYAGVQVRNT